MTEPIYACLWCNNNGQELAEYYCSIFPNSRIISQNATVVIFEANGTKFMTLNGGPRFKFDEAISFVITCKNQGEIDHYWDALTAEGEESRCGWLKDKYDVSWQIIPENIADILSHHETGGMASQALLKMNKIILEDLLSNT